MLRFFSLFFSILMPLGSIHISLDCASVFLVTASFFLTFLERKKKEILSFWSCCLLRFFVFLSSTTSLSVYKKRKVFLLLLLFISRSFSLLPCFLNDHCSLSRRKIIRRLLASFKHQAINICRREPIDTSFLFLFSLSSAFELSKQKWQIICSYSINASLTFIQPWKARLCFFLDVCWTFSGFF